MSTLKEQFKSISIISDLAKQLYWRIIRNLTKRRPFPGSQKYWEERYASGGTSGVGSYETFAEFKAEIVNSFVARHGVMSVIEFGCGDGNQLGLANYQQYLGLDVSETAIDLCKHKFASDTNKTFKLMREYEGEVADLSLSLDVIFHLIEDEVFESHICSLFKASSRYVIIYSSNYNKRHKADHVRHRQFTPWVEENAPDWRIKDHIPNRYPYHGDYKKGSFADFYIYEKA